MKDTELYNRIQNAVSSPVIKVGRKLSELQRLDVLYQREDVVQEFYIFFKTSDGEGSFENKFQLENILFNWLRRKIREVQHQPDTINEASQCIPLDERRAPSSNELSGGYGKVYDKVLSFGILDDTDLEVLQGKCSRITAAKDKGKKYDAYQRELYRKLTYIRNKIPGGLHDQQR